MTHNHSDLPRDPEDGRPAQGRLAMFTYADAPDFWDTDMLSELGGSEETLEQYRAAWDDGQSQGSVTKVLFRQAGDSGTSMLHVWQKPGKVTPRHSHDSDCLYYVISGALHMGNRTFGPGDGFFVPGGHPYGVTAGEEGAELLEIRPHATAFDMQIRDQDPERWATFADGVRACQPCWTGRDVPPSLAARTVES